MNNKGFIATSLIYSFFLIFITLFLTIIADYLQNKVLLNTIELGIKDTINKTKTIEDFDVGDSLDFGIDATINEKNVSNGSSWVIASINHKDKKIVLYSANKDAGIDSCSSEEDCVSLDVLHNDLKESSTDNLTKQLDIVNLFMFNNPLNNEIYNYKIVDNDNKNRLISKNCIKVTDDALDFTDCNEASDGDTTNYRRRIVLDITNVKFEVNPVGTGYYTITRVI